jgi:hypothetical protein
MHPGIDERLVTWEVTVEAIGMRDADRIEAETPRFRADLIGK